MIESLETGVAHMIPARRPSPSTHLTTKALISHIYSNFTAYIIVTWHKAACLVLISIPEDMEGRRD